MRRKVEPVKKVARRLKELVLHLLNYLQHPITNALTEGFNSNIQAIEADARGFRRSENYCAIILFFCGKLDLSLSCLHHLSTTFRKETIFVIFDRQTLQHHLDAHQI